MSDYRIKISTAPALEPVTVEDVKLHAHIDHDVEDSIIQTWIKSARETAEGFQRRAYITQVVDLIFDEFPDMPFLLPRSPVTTFTHLKYYDTVNTETTYSHSTYMIVDLDSEPGRIDHAYGVTWPATTLRSLAAVKIRYSAGYGSTAESVPATVKDAIMLYCSWKNDNRTGESGEAPRQFFDLLRPDRIHL